MLKTGINFEPTRSRVFQDGGMGFRAVFGNFSKFFRFRAIFADFCRFVPPPPNFLLWKTLHHLLLTLYLELMGFFWGILWDFNFRDF